MGIEGKIAKILNTRELVINRGSEHGVEPRMEFAVMEMHFTIFDPDTQEPLGDLEKEKIRVRVFETHPKFSLARTYETYQESNPRPGLYRSLGLPPEFVTKVKTLNILCEPVYQDGIANVIVGDVVTQLPEMFPNATKKDK